MTFEAPNSQSSPTSHVTVSRAMQIVDVVVVSPGVTYAEITRAVGAPKSSVYGFIRGMLAVDWLVDRDHRLYPGPAFYSMVLADGQLRAGLITAADLDDLYRETGLSVHLNVRAGDVVIAVTRAGPPTFDHTIVRRDLLNSAGGKTLLAFLPAREMNDYLRRRVGDDRHRVEAFLMACGDIRATGVAVDVDAASGLATVAAVVRNGAGHPTAALTLIGDHAHVVPRLDSLVELLRRRASALGQGAPRL